MRKTRNDGMSPSVKKRLYELQEAATKAFADKKERNQWLYTRQAQLGGLAPIWAATMSREKFERAMAQLEERMPD